jgi:hypothetical protein
VIWLQDALHKLDAGLPFIIKTWTKDLDGALFASRVATISLGVLGVLGAMLAFKASRLDPVVALRSE